MWVAKIRLLWHNKLTNYNVSVGNNVGLKIGMQLLLEPIVNERNERFRCKVVEMEAHAFYIDYPINVLTRKTAFLMDGAQFKVTFVDGESSYVFNTEVLGRKNVGIPTISMKQPQSEEMMKMQRREFVRVQTAIDVAIQAGEKAYQLTLSLPLCYHFQTAKFITS